jgi:hypothetical protein
MPTKDTSELKEKILDTIRQNGPRLPVHIARATDLSILFASAFLSELLSNGKIKMSHMRVGSSPLYYISGQESQLKNFSQHLNDKEKEAFTLLQDKKSLDDSKQSPAIRVALRAIKDFAVPFKREDKIFWRYYLIPEDQITIPPIKLKAETIKKAETLNIFETPKPEKKKIKKDSKSNDKFFNGVKEFLSLNATEILDIESFSKNEIILKTKKGDEEEILIVYNKKRISEEDIIKAYKKVSEKNSRYRILCLGESSKKTNNLIDAIRHLKGIDKMDFANKNL